MKHRAAVKFWQYYENLPAETKRLADNCYELLKNDPRHGSLQLKKTGRFWSVRVGIHYRAVAVQEGEDFVWFWIEHHSEYDRLLGSR